MSAHYVRAVILHHISQEVALNLGVNMSENNTKSNYFVPFGLKQICDILMGISSITLIVGLFVSGDTFIVALVGACIMILGSLLSLIKCIMVMFSGINKNSSTYKNAIINLVLMGFVFCLSLFATIYIIIIL